jgi:predicted RNA methylase
MINENFYPTPPHIIEYMCNGLELAGANILEPSAGSGNIVEYALRAGANVIACELEPKLQHILRQKCKVIADDFLQVKAEQVSHITHILMNPPFTADERHILHAYEIAPNNCTIIALCNSNTIGNRYTRQRQELYSVIENYGSYELLGNVFKGSERSTGVDITLVKLHKYVAGDSSEFEGFFLEDEPEEQGEGIMQYNVVRDIVNRYVEAIKIFDEQQRIGMRMANTIGNFFQSKIAFAVTQEGAPMQRAVFKKDLQKSAWQYVFKQLNMEKYATKGLREDINKFVETQTHVPFTMKNIYRMLEIIIGTQSQRMDKALLEVFEKVTRHTHENRYNVEGWKTNSHYLLNEKFIMPHAVNYEWHKLRANYHGWAEPIDDMHKALCFMEGKPYNNDYAKSFAGFLSENDCQTNTWYSWGFFEFKGFKKGTVHVKFQDKDVWARFNQNIARIMGYPLFEGK